MGPKSKSPQDVDRTEGVDLRPSFCMKHPFLALAGACLPLLPITLVVWIALVSWAAWKKWSR